MNKEKTTNRHVRNDIIFIAVLLLAAALGAIYLFMFRSLGDTVRVTVNGEPYGVYSLSQNITEDIRTGNNNEQLNRLVIRDGKAYVEAASCPDGICAAHRAISRNGESIICLPNRVVITVESKTQENEPDIIVQGAVYEK
jgi:hypothetical protein